MKVSQRKFLNNYQGLKEEHFQTALGVEFRKNKIDFMREAGLELFYDNHPIGLHELDFLIPPCMDLKEALLLLKRKLALKSERNTDNN